MIATVREATKLTLNVIIRPRSGDFLYSPQEADIMAKDIIKAKELGVDGVVFGCLTSSGCIDCSLTERLIAVARPLSVTFHRAFDVCRAPLQSLSELITLGCDRLLTSGCSRTAFEGIPLLRNLVEFSSGRIVIMPGCGITAENIACIEAETGAKEFHASAGSIVASDMQYRNEAVSMGASDSGDYFRKETDVSKVSALVHGTVI
jgi:copper homeostasis protein